MNTWIGEQIHDNVGMVNGNTGNWMVGIQAFNIKFNISIGLKIVIKQNGWEKK